MITLLSTLLLTTNFEHGQELSRAYDKPMVVLFTGSDWSQESQKLIRQFDEQELGSKYLFVQVDFPEGKVVKGIEKAHALKEKYDVQAFPTALLLTPMGEEVTRFGILEKEYAAHIRNSLKTFTRLEEADFVAASDEELVSYYNDATKLGNRAFVDAILEVAKEQGRCPDLLIDLYCKTKDETLREKIISMDIESSRLERLTGNLE